MMVYVKRTMVLLGLSLLLAACTGSRKHEEVATPASPVADTPHVVKPRPTKKAGAVKTKKEPFSPPQVFLPQAPGNRVAQVSVPGPYVALTFDDGPNPNTTPQVLDILRRHGVKATFFVVGQSAARHKDIVARAAAEGHEIGSHTWDHPSLTKLSHEGIVSQMDRTAAAIREATGRMPAVMRPPYGATNKTIIDFLVSRYGTPSILWSVDTQDWRHPGVDVVIHRAVDPVKNGSIILLHDIHASTLAAVDGVVRGLLARGFKLVTVSELIEMGRRAASEGGIPRPGVPLTPAGVTVRPVVEPRSAEPQPAESPAAPEPAPAAETPAQVAEVSAPQADVAITTPAE